jgi:hypothetical protein
MRRAKRLGLLSSRSSTGKHRALMNRFKTSDLSTRFQRKSTSQISIAFGSRPRQLTMEPRSARLEARCRPLPPPRASHPRHCRGPAHFLRARPGPPSAEIAIAALRTSRKLVRGVRKSPRVPKRNHRASGRLARTRGVDLSGPDCGKLHLNALTREVQMPRCGALLEHL